MAAAALKSISPFRTYSYPNKLAGKTFYVEPYTAALTQANEWQATRPADAADLRYLASQPRGIWIGFWNTDPGSAVRNILAATKGSNATPMFVVYNVPSFSCEAYSANPKQVSANYMKWLTDFADGITAPSVIILEPDALAGRECLNSRKSNLLKKAVAELKRNSNAIVYIDAGHGEWNSVDAIAQKLNNAGIDIADGFSLNVSNFRSTPTTIEYGTNISNKVKNKHFVIDTSRNGESATPLNYEWCNQRNRAIGTLPSSDTGNTLVDAYLWIKQPGQSDGTCNGGPEAGVWWPEYALELVQNSRQ